ncbi:MAG TPA: S41 family peptidase [Waterburya sp.]|jgi:carboxyl-terminal processing protease
MIKYLTKKSLRLVTSIGFTILLILLPILLQVSSAQTSPYLTTFNEAWGEINDNFFDPKFNGVDWESMRSKYEPMAARTQSKEELAAVINQMLSELKTSHTHFYTSDEPAYYQILGIFQPISTNLQKQIINLFPKGKIEYNGIGIFTKNINDKIFVSGVLDGSPAAKAGLKVGDQLLSVDGRPFHPIQSFAGKVGQNVKLLIVRSPNPKSQQEITVTPKMLDATTMFVDAMTASTQVIERDGKKIGYIHIWSYAGDKYQQQLEEELLYGRLSEADGFVLDLREGWGGAPLTALNIYTAQNLSVRNIPRNGRQYTSNSAWKKPVVMLVNQGSRSAKEILAFGFRQYGIGPVVGTKTAGAVVAGRPFIMQDGSLLYVAVSDVYVNGNERLEGKGVTPDITVPLSLEYAQGADPQKERAIEVVLAAVKQS